MLLCRGGSSGYPPGPGYEQASNYDGYSPTELPPELPPGEDDGYGPSRQDPRQQHQHSQQEQQFPPFPPQDYGPEREPPPRPPGFEESMFDDAMEEPGQIDWGGVTNEAGMDLSAFNKEYILKGLAKLYRKKILPLEISSRYGHFHSPPLSPADFVAPPMVLLIGQYRYE
jgi:hypothetical protein